MYTFVLDFDFVENCCQLSSIAVGASEYVGRDQRLLETTSEFYPDNIGKTCLELNCPVVRVSCVYVSYHARLMRVFRFFFCSAWFTRVRDDPP